MILVCPACHRSYVHDDAEVAARGGPSGHTCDECGHALATMADAMGITLHNDDTAESDPGMTLDASAQEMFPDGEESFESAEVMYPGDDEATELRPAFDDRPMGQSESTLPQVQAIDLPPGQLVVGGTGQSHTGSIQAPAAQKPRLSTRITGQHNAIVGPPPSSSAKATLPLDSDPRHAATVASQPALHRVAASNSRPIPKKGGGVPTAAIAGGCLVVAVLVLILGAGGTAVFFVSGSGEGDMETSGDAGADVTERSLEDRLREAASSVPNSAVPTVPLRNPLQDGAVVFVGSTAVTYHGETLATVSLGRVSASAKPNPDSPLVLPLARALDDTFTQQFSDPLDAENAIRWVIVMPDAKVGYRTIYEVLYTCWERGARMQLAATNPTNPHAFVATEVMPNGWPNADHVGVPDDLPRRTPAIENTSKTNALTVTITEKGFLLRGPGERRDEAVKMARVTAYPVSRLGKMAGSLQRDPRIRSLRIEASGKVAMFVVLQAIAAVTGAKDGPPQITEVRLSPPDADL